MYKYLDNIDSPNDIKGYSASKMKVLASEIRHFLITEIHKTGGHLASNLGVVELTLALYKVFDAPEDKILFDVGHQSYVSKILTGRRKRFDLLRCENGISGFPKRSESEYDAFGTGHSSTALSAALGIARANKLAGKNSYVVAVVGDGAFSGGLCYEAINNCAKDLNLILVLNENEMSISQNVGNMASMISSLRSRENYFKVKDAVQSSMEKVPVIGDDLVTGVRRTKKALKNAIFNTNLLENFGFTYFGPIDGNDYETVERVIAQAKKRGGNAFIHVKTVKGKGYAPAEKNPAGYHMVKPDKHEKQTTSFSAKFGEFMEQLGEKNKRVCAISAAMKDGTGLRGFFRKYPDRSFDVGIAEGHAVTFAAGLASENYIPVFAVYSSFFQRAFDNYLHDVAIQNLHCVFAIDRAGLSPDDGATHHGIYDVSMLSLSSDSVVFSPICYETLNMALKEAVASNNGIYGIRYPKGSESTKGLVSKESFVFCDEDTTENADVTVVTYGRIYNEALKAKIELKEKGISCNVVVLEKILPYSFSYRMVKKYCCGTKRIILLEEGIESGGFCQNILTRICSAGEMDAGISVLAIKGSVPGHARLETLYSECGISASDIVKAAENEN